MRRKTWLLYASVAALVAAVSACGESEKKPAESTPDAPAAMQSEFAEPRPDHVLQIGVKSATRTGDRIELVLDGTYGGDRTTQWDMTSVEAVSDTGDCQVTAAPGFPAGSSRPRSVVTGMWALNCSGQGPVNVTVDPFGGLLDSDTSFRITLR